MIEYKFLDCFCGLGGASEGIEQVDNCQVVVAVNHDSRAIACAKINHPHIHYVNDDIRKVDPRKLKEQFPEVNAFWWSPDCTHFSKAKGGSSRDPDSRMLAGELDQWVDAFRPKIIFIENVTEFRTWGPMREKLDKEGKILRNKKSGKPILEPDPARKGESYFSWIRRIREKGYDFDDRNLNSANHGGFTSRTRFFGVFIRKDTDQRYKWPQITHIKSGKNDLINLPRWKACAEILDLEDKGPSLFYQRYKIRKHALVPATLSRVHYGNIKHGPSGEGARITSFRSYILKYYTSSGNPNQSSSMEDPLPTITTKERFALVETNFIAGYFSCNGRPNGVSSTASPLGSLTTEPKYYLATFLSSTYGGHNALRRAHSVNMPTPTFTTAPNLSLVQTIERGQAGKSEVPDPNGMEDLISEIHKGRQEIVEMDPLHGAMLCEHLYSHLTSGKTPRLRDDQPLFELCQSTTIGPMPPWAIQRGRYWSDIRIVDIWYRMLKVEELARAMGFPPDYHFDKSKSTATKHIGNAVEINTVRALVSSFTQSEIQSQSLTA